MNQSASSIWYGTGREGNGNISTQSKVLDEVEYRLSSRIDNQPGTSPEELIAAAHAGCFNMALAVVLGDAGHGDVLAMSAGLVARVATLCRVRRVMMVRANYGRILLRFFKNSLIRELSFRAHFLINVVGELGWVVMMLIFRKSTIQSSTFSMSPVPGRVTICW